MNGNMKRVVLLLMMTGFLNSAFSQRLADTALLSMNRDQQGVYFHTKARKQNTLGWILLGSGFGGLVLSTTYVATNWNSGNEGLLLGMIAVSSAAMVGGIVAFVNSANNKGKGEMLLRKPARAEGPEVEQDLAIMYRRKHRTLRAVGWGLVGTSVLTNIIAAGQYDRTGLSTVSSLSLIASIPVFIASSRNKGRASVLFNTQKIPFSYLSSPMPLTSVGVGISLGSTR
jgi:hypothetical protein